MTPRAEATAFRIWQYCEKITTWDQTAHEVADALGVTRRYVTQIVNVKGWASRFRSHLKASTWNEGANCISHYPMGL